MADKNIDTDRTGAECVLELRIPLESACERHGAGIESSVVASVRCRGWEEDGGWLGCLHDFPGYWTQGETLDDLKEHLCDLYRDLTSGRGPA